MAAAALIPIAPAHAAPAHAQTHLVVLRGAGGTECPTDADLRAAVAERLGYSPFAAQASRTIVASMRREKDTWRGAIQVADTEGRITGTRELTSNAASCADLGSTLALTIALVLDPDAATGPQKPNPEAVAPPALPSPGLPVAVRTALPDAENPFYETPRPPPPVVRARVSVAGGIGAVSSLGAAPSVAIGVEAFVGITAGSFRLELEGRADAPASGDTAGGAAARTSLAIGTLSPCYVRGVLALCGLASLGALSGEGVGSSTARSRLDTGLFAAIGARVAVEAPLGSTLFVRVHGDFLVPLTRTSLDVGGLRVWTNPPFSGALGLSLGMRFF